MPETRTAQLLATALVAALPLGCSESPQPSSPTAPGGISSASRALVEVPADLSDVTTGYTGTDNWAGQSVTITGAGSFDNLRFCWYHYNPSGTPTAFGTLYLLTQEYLGLPADLSPSTPGFVARSEGVVDGEYIFPSRSTIAAGRQYWFYGDTRGRFTSSFNKDVYAGGDLYVAGLDSVPFRKSLASWLRLPSGEYLKPEPGTCTDANFRLRGAATR